MRGRRIKIVDRIIDAGQLPDAAVVQENCAAGIATRQMRFIRLRALVKRGINQIVSLVWGEVGHVVFAPAPHAVTRAPTPAAQSSAEKNFAAALRASADDNKMLPDFVGLGVKRGERRESFIHLPDQQVAVCLAEGANKRVRRSLKNKIRSGLANVRGADKKMRRDWRAEETAPIAFELPAAVRESAARRGDIRRRIAGIEQNHRTRVECGEDRQGDQHAKLFHGSADDSIPKRSTPADSSLTVNQ